MKQTMIPRIVLQTAREPLPDHVMRRNNPYIRNWRHEFYDDARIESYLDQHRIEDFPNAKDKFLSFKNGAHKADFFRYYYLLINGGVFIDSDAVLARSLDKVSAGLEFFAVDSSYVPMSIFQGFLGCKPNHEIIYQALKDLYERDQSDLDDDYMIVCKTLYEIYHASPRTSAVLFQERFLDLETACMTDQWGRIIGYHYWKTKIVPPHDDKWRKWKFEGRLVLKTVINTARQRLRLS